jgi:minor extracellular serine protease Vpr
MYKFILVILTTIILISPTSIYARTLIHPPIPQESPNTEKVAIVLLDKPQSPERILSDFPELKLRYVFEHALIGFSVIGPVQALEQLKKQSNILNVSLVSTYQVEETVAISRIPIKQIGPLPDNENINIIGGDEAIRLHDDQNEHVTGKGVKVAVIDTGIDYNHPDLKANFKGGRDFVDNDNDPMESTKLSGMPTLHGTHVAGVIAANGKIKGVAPDAQIIAYRALGPGGHGTTEQVIAAIEQAIKDKVDIVNLSLGNNVNGPDLPISLALNKVVENGIVAVASSGNSGPNRWTVGSPGTASKAISVGASTPTMKIPYLLIPGNQKIRMEPIHGASDWNILRPMELVFGGLGYTKDLINVKGKIVLLERGKLTFTQKVTNAAKAGAKAVIIYNNTNGSFIGNLEKEMDIPVTSITKKQGEQLKNWEHLVARTILIEEKDILAAFSSRGPVTSTWEIKPDVVAPGVAINSTIPGGYLSLQGTSMAAPHVAGACALIKQAHPDWSPEEIKAALMNTAKPIANEKGQPYKTYEQGSGRIQPVNAIKAESLVMPASLQFGKFQLADQQHHHQAKLTVKNVSNNVKSYYFSIPSNERGIEWNLPLTFSLNPGEQKEVSLGMTVNPEQFSKKLYDGHLIIKESVNEIRIPYLYVLEEPDYPRVMGFEFGNADKEDTYRYEVYLPGGAEEFGIALFDPDFYKFIGFLDAKRDVTNGLIQKEIPENQLPKPGFYLAKVFAKKGGREDMLEVMIEIVSRNEDRTYRKQIVEPPTEKEDPQSGIKVPPIEGNRKPIKIEIPLLGPD